MKNTANNNKTTKSIQDLKNFEITKTKQTAIKGGFIIEDIEEFQEKLYSYIQFSG